MAAIEICKFVLAGKTEQQIKSIMSGNFEGDALLVAHQSLGAIDPTGWLLEGGGVD